VALPVKFTFSALRSIDEALVWWSRNRDKAPHALAEDLEQALALISSYPQIGTRARHRWCAHRRTGVSMSGRVGFQTVVFQAASASIIAAFTDASVSN
jgi:plasmid stabilization system protein ParE